LAVRVNEKSAGGKGKILSVVSIHTKSSFGDLIARVKLIVIELFVS